MNQKEKEAVERGKKKHIISIRSCGPLVCVCVCDREKEKRAHLQTTNNNNTDSKDGKYEKVANEHKVKKDRKRNDKTGVFFF